MAETSYASCGDLSLAYQVFGGGPVELVFVGPMVTHVELFWILPECKAFFEQLATFCRVLLFDKAGVGLSDPIPKVRLLEERAAEIEAVMRLAPALSHYLAAWPEVSVELSLDDRVMDMAQEGFDVSIRIGHLKDSGLIARPLQPYRMRICGAPAYLARAGTPRTLAELAQHQCLGFSHWNRDGQWSLRSSSADEEVGPACRLISNHGGALRMAALEGVGLVMQAEALVGDDIASGRLVSLLEDHLPAPRPMHLLYPRDRQPVPKLTTFVDFMMERFGLDTAAAPGAAARVKQVRDSRKRKKPS